MKFSTSDFGAATALMTLGHRIDRLDRTNPRRVEFIFEDNGRITRDYDDYFKGDLRVSALELSHNIRGLKAMLYQS